MNNTRSVVARYNMVRAGAARRMRVRCVVSGSRAAQRACRLAALRCKLRRLQLGAAALRHKVLSRRRALTCHNHSTIGS